MTSESILLNATLNGDLDTVKQSIRDGVNLNCKDDFGRGPLLSFYPEIIQLLIEHGANPNNQFNENGHTVLSGLCYANTVFKSKNTNQLDCVKILVENGANIEVGYVPSNETPLHHATAPMGIENIGVIKYLLENKANPNSKTIPNIGSHNFYEGAQTKGESPLHRAAAFCTIETIDLLLSFGANRETLDINGEKPLSWACWHRRPKQLIDKLR